MILRMSLFFALVISGTAFAAPSGVRMIFDIEGVAGEKAHKMETRYFMQKGSVRVESEMPGSPMGSSVFIHQTKPEKTYLLSPADKTYFEMPKTTHEIENMPQSEKEAFKPTNKKRKVAGYPCKVWERKTARRHEEVCLNKELIKDFRPEDFSPSVKNRKSLLPKGMDGFPLEYISKGIKTKNEQQTMRMREFHRENLNQALFTVPKDYTKKEMPAGPSPDDMKKMMQQYQTGDGTMSPEMQKKMEEMKAWSEKMKKTQ